MVSRVSIGDPSAEIVFNPKAFLLKREYMGRLPARPFIQMSATVDDPSEDTLSIPSPHAPLELRLAATNTVGRESTYERLITKFDGVYPS
jgi:hypothetical protein